MKSTIANGKSGITRRGVLKGSAAAVGLAAGSGAITGFPTIWAQSIKDITINHTGQSYSTLIDIARQASKDLGFKVEMSVIDTAGLTNRMINDPTSIDVADTEIWQTKIYVPAGKTQAVDTKKIKEWDKVTPLYTQGTFNGKPVSLEGDSPIKIMYRESKDATSFHKGATQWATFLPGVYNADTLGIRPDLIKRPIESWKELLNPEFKGKAAILNIPSIGIMDAALVVEASGIHKYADKGNMTKAEIDLTMKVLTEAKKSGQFRAFWQDFNESVNLMASGEVVIQSMWSPAVTAVRSKGIPCIYQPLKEGYRAWAAGFGIPRTLTGRKADLAYEFINWFLDGWAGAYLNRQGYYSGVLETAKSKMEPYEWAFWMEGKPAEKDIHAPDGTLLEKAGTVRDGGSYEDRMGSVVCWNSVMDENDYLVKKWNEFIAA